MVGTRNIHDANLSPLLFLITGAALFVLFILAMLDFSPFLKEDYLQV